MNKISIEGKTIGFNSPIYLIAEVGVNHNGVLSIAKQLVNIAAKAKVDAIKFQTFKTEKLILKSTPKVEYQKVTTHDNESFYDMLKKYELNKEEFRILKKYSNKIGLTFLSTPFDDTSVDWLEELNVPAYKVGSGDMNNFPLLKSICSKGKPIFLSTGMATLDEVKKSVDYIKKNNINKIVIFQCTTNYPAAYEELNLNVIETYKKEFPNDIIGFSDHSLGIEASIGAAVKGVKVIEKHFTLNKDMEGPDHKASIDPDELIGWVKAIRNIENALGSYTKKPSESEKNIAKIARKSIVSARNLEIGEILKPDDFTIKRPGTGISPTDYNKVIGKRVKKKIPKDSTIFWEDLE